MEILKVQATIYKTLDGSEFTSKKIAEIHEKKLSNLLESDVYILTYTDSGTLNFELVAAEDSLFIEKYLDNRNIDRTIYDDGHLKQNDEYIKVCNGSLIIDPVSSDYLDYINKIKDSLLGSSLIIQDLILLNESGDIENLIIDTKKTV